MVRLHRGYTRTDTPVPYSTLFLFLVEAVVRRSFLAERLATLPRLLDELLDARVAGPLPERDDFAPQCAQALAHEDTEAALMVPNETRQALSFRIALATLDGRQHAQESARQLAWLADAVLGVVLQLALRETRRAHRSEEHTSELQSLMRISYAVF